MKTLFKIVWIAWSKRRGIHAYPQQAMNEHQLHRTMTARDATLLPLRTEPCASERHSSESGSEKQGKLSHQPIIQQARGCNTVKKVGWYSDSVFWIS